MTEYTGYIVTAFLYATWFALGLDILRTWISALVAGVSEGVCLRVLYWTASHFLAVCTLLMIGEYAR